MSERVRLDVYLAQNGLSTSREQAKALIIAGHVLVDGQTQRTPSALITPDRHVEVRRGPEFVSRGGHKLARALEVFGIDVAGKICADLGASTGGFTDCMLKRGASHVYAVDVGYGQLAWSLRNDERVTSMERTNARHLLSLPCTVDFVSMDLSFISVLQVLPAAMRISMPQAPIVALIKPQFEAGRENVGKKGVVKDPNIHLEVLESVSGKAAELGLGLQDVTFSPIKGPNGNIEFPGLFIRGAQSLSVPELRQVVDDAHEKLT